MALSAEDLLDSPSLPDKVPSGSFVARILFVDCLVRHGFGTEHLVPCLDQTEAHAAFVPGITVESLQKLNMKMTKWNQNGRQVRLMTAGRALAMVHSKLRWLVTDRRLLWQQKQCRHVWGLTKINHPSRPEKPRPNPRTTQSFCTEPLPYRSAVLQNIQVQIYSKRCFQCLGWLCCWALPRDLLWIQTGHWERRASRGLESPTRHLCSLELQLALPKGHFLFWSCPQMDLNHTLETWRWLHLPRGLLRVWSPETERPLPRRPQPWPGEGWQAPPRLPHCPVARSRTGH